jgi:hypothetical protein
MISDARKSFVGPPRDRASAGLHRHRHPQMRTVKPVEQARD